MAMNSQTRAADRYARQNRQAHWELLGASGLLRPLSEEFLYRSPSAPLRDSSRRYTESTDETV